MLIICCFLLWDGMINEELAKYVYPSYFKLHVRWQRLLTPVTYFSKLLGFTDLPPSCNLNYLGYRIPAR
ncbi:hypothetical protein FDX05_07425 [Citrobacter sp. wls715]|nr:hypothetical protein FDX05_07425 [Citrobacter sp. wls715]